MRIFKKRAAIAKAGRAWGKRLNRQNKSKPIETIHKTNKLDAARAKALKAGIFCHDATSPSNNRRHRAILELTNSLSLHKFREGEKSSDFVSPAKKLFVSCQFVPMRRNGVS